MNTQPSYDEKAAQAALDAADFSTPILKSEKIPPEAANKPRVMDDNGYTEAMAEDWANQSSNTPELPDDWDDYAIELEPPEYMDNVIRIANGTKRDKIENVRRPFEFSRWTNSDVLADDAIAPNYLINGILEQDSHGMLAGASMAFKTFVNIDIAHSICTGADFMGRKVYQTGKVLYVCGEGHGALARRIKAKKIVSGGFNDNLLVMNVSTRIDNEADMAQLKKDIEEINPVLVIFDTFASLVGDTDENSPSAVGKALRLIKETCRNGFTSSITTHHSGKDPSRGMRGASNFKNDVDFAFDLTRQADSMITTMSCVKMKDGEEFKDIHMDARVVELGLIRQDGTQATSLVLMPSDYVAKAKTKSLTDHQSKSFDALKKAILENGQTDIPEIVRQLFPDNPANIPCKITTIDQWRKLAYLTMTVTNKDEKSKYDTLLKAFDRTRKPLSDAGKIGFYGDYVWIIEHKTDTRTGQDIL